MRRVWAQEEEREKCVPLPSDMIMLHVSVPGLTWVTIHENMIAETIRNPQKKHGSRNTSESTLMSVKQIYVDFFFILINPPP